MLEEHGIYLMDLGDSLILYILKKAKIEDKETIYIEIPRDKKPEIHWTEKMSNLLSELSR